MCVCVRRCGGLTLDVSDDATAGGLLGVLLHLFLTLLRSSAVGAAKRRRGRRGRGGRSEEGEVEEEDGEVKRRRRAKEGITRRRGRKQMIGTNKYPQIS